MKKKTIIRRSLDQRNAYEISSSQGKKINPISKIQQRFPDIAPANIQRSSAGVLEKFLESRGDLADQAQEQIDVELQEKIERLRQKYAG